MKDLRTIETFALGIMKSLKGLGERLVKQNKEVQAATTVVNTNPVLIKFKDQKTVKPEEVKLVSVEKPEVRAVEKQEVKTESGAVKEEQTKVEKINENELNEEAQYEQSKVT